MRQFFTLSLSAMVLVAMGSFVQAQQGMPSQATLNAMGLSGMQVVSDSEAMSIRGHGYQRGKSIAIAFGVSYAHVGGKKAGAGSIDGFLAIGKHHASGKHGSIAGKIVIGGGHGGMPQPWGNSGGPPTWGNDNGGYRPQPHVKAVVVFAGGFAHSSAY